MFDAISSAEDSFLIGSFKVSKFYGVTLLTIGLFPPKAVFVFTSEIGLLLVTFNGVLFSCFSGVMLGLLAALTALTTAFTTDSEVSTGGANNVEGALKDALSIGKVEVTTITNFVVNGVCMKSMGQPCCLARMSAILVLMSMLSDLRI